MNNLFQKTYDVLKKKRVKQVGSLYLSMFISLIVGIGVSIINTRFLGKEAYGDLKFLQNIFSFAIYFITLGLFYSGSRLIAKKEYSGIKHQLFGNQIIISLLLSVFLFLFFFIFSFPQEKIFDNDLGYIIRLFSPLLFIYPFQLCFENVLQGDNRIYELSVFRLGPKLFYLIAVLIFTFFYGYTLTSALVFYFITIILFIIITGFRLKPRFDKVREMFRIVWNENKTYGFPVYIGSIAGLASTQIAGLTISYFVDNTNVGFFYLAITASMPLAMLPNTAGITFFKDFANMDQIPRKVFIFTLLIALVALTGFILLIKPLVILLYTEEYIEVVPLAYLISIGSTFHGLGDFFNRFLSAHGKGKQLRNSNFVIGLCNVVGYIGLVCYSGVSGAAVTKLIAGIIYAGLLFFYYYSYLKNSIIKTGNVSRK